MKSHNASSERAQHTRPIGKKTIIIGVCASIAAYRVCELINLLKRDGINIIICMSKDAHHFVAPLTLQTLSANKVYQDMFASSHDYSPIHISLAKLADLICVIPATSDIISKVAAGICDELLTCTIASTKAPILFAPAMNDAMYTNKILQANITKLEKLGYYFAGPEQGRLACGTTGKGHIACTQDIICRIKRLLK
jgi:phosphopantothenoylcysteine synthetase/decarboxylase